MLDGEVASGRRERDDIHRSAERQKMIEPSPSLSQLSGLFPASDHLLNWRERLAKQNGRCQHDPGRSEVADNQPCAGGHHDYLDRLPLNFRQVSIERTAVRHFTLSIDEKTLPDIPRAHD